MRKIIIIMVLLCLVSCDENHNPIEMPVVSDVEDNVVIEAYDFDHILEKLEAVPNMRNISVQIEGQTILESYYGGSNEMSKNNVFSVTKSVTSLLVGIAIEEGFIDGVDQKMSDFIDLSDYDVPETFYDITIEHLLTMSSGIEWDSYDISSEYIQLKASIDPLEHILKRSLSFEPGTAFNYSDGTAHLVAEVLYQATGDLPEVFAQKYLFDPLGIENIRWSSANNGVNIGGCDLHLSCQDMQKIGLLALDGGQYDGKQIVAREWLELSTTSHIQSISPLRHNKEYGFFWWLGEVESNEVFSALGHGGQFIICIPDKKIVVTASTIGGVSDQMAARQFTELEEILYDDLMVLLLEK